MTFFIQHRLRQARFSALSRTRSELYYTALSVHVCIRASIYYTAYIYVHHHQKYAHVNPLLAPTSPYHVKDGCYIKAEDAYLFAVGHAFYERILEFYLIAYAEILDVT